MAEPNGKIEYLNYQDLVHHLEETDESHQKAIHRIYRESCQCDEKGNYQIPLAQ